MGEVRERLKLELVQELLRGKISKNVSMEKLKNVSTEMLNNIQEIS